MYKVRYLLNLKPNCLLVNFNSIFKHLHYFQMRNYFHVWSGWLEVHISNPTKNTLTFSNYWWIIQTWMWITEVSVCPLYPYLDGTYTYHGMALSVYPSFHPSTVYIVSKRNTFHSHFISGFKVCWDICRHDWRPSSIWLDIRIMINNTFSHFEYFRGNF